MGREKTIYWKNSMRSFLYAVVAIGVLAIPSTSLAAFLSLSPASGTYSVGDRITVKILVSSSDASINAVSGALSFSNTTGTVNFEGVALAGFQGNAGTLVTMTFRALKAGSGAISFQSGQVLANDGQGTDITSGLSG